MQEKQQPLLLLDNKPKLYYWKKEQIWLKPCKILHKPKQILQKAMSFPILAAT